MRPSTISSATAVTLPLTLAMALVLAACTAGSDGEPSAARDQGGQDAQDQDAQDQGSDKPEASRSDDDRGDATPAPSSEVGDGLDEDLSCPGPANDAAVGLRPDVNPSGNRLVPGSFQLADDDIINIDLGARPLWVTAAPEATGQRQIWYALLDTGESVTITVDGDAQPVVEAAPTFDTVDNTAVPGYRPEAEPGDNPVDLGTSRTVFTNPLADGRVVRAGDWAAALVDPTDRYGHGVLGDAVEAAGVEILNVCDERRAKINIDAPNVVEGVSPMLIDTPKGDPAVLVTTANGDVGAWLALYDIDGSLIAQSDPIGTGRRWRNQLGAGPIGPDGSFAVVDIRTPHIGGTVQWFGLDRDSGRLELVAASEAAYTTHQIGSRNLDLGVAVDVNGDGRPEIVVPGADRRSLSALAPTTGTDGDVGGAEIVTDISLPDAMSTNLAVATDDSRLRLAVGTEDGRLLIFG